MRKLLELGADPEPRLETVTPPLLPVCDWVARDLFGEAPVASLEGCLNAGAVVGVRGQDGETPLHTVVDMQAWNHTFAAAAVAALLKAGADPDARDQWGATPLHRAVGLGSHFGPGSFIAQHATVAALVEGGADVNARDKRGETPLHHAARVHSFDNTSTAAVLVEAGANVHARSVSGSTPLHSAAQHSEHPGMIELLVRAGSAIDARDEIGNTPLHSALGGGSPAVVARLLELGADPALANDSGSFADPASCTRWPTPMFFHHATVEAAARCIGDGAKVNADLDHESVATGAARTEPNAGGSTPLHVAAGWARDPEVIVLLVRSGADVNGRNESGYSPLHHAGRGQASAAVVAALVEAGAEVNAWATGSSDGYGNRDVTPLHEAARKRECRGGSRGWWGPEPRLMLWRREDAGRFTARLPGTRGRRL